MKAFTFDPADYSAEFRARGYVHIKNGASVELLSSARRQLTDFCLSRRNELPGKEIRNKKKQCLFELPDDSQFLSELAGVIAGVASLPATQMTLSERHIKIYEDNAQPQPSLHKDCVASQVAVGIPLQNGAHARLVLLPRVERQVNPLDNAIYRRANSSDNDAPLSELIELDAAPGDVVIFAGSSIYHERYNAAGSAILYLKLNAMRLDHLAEDPSTILQRKNSMRILQNRSDHELLESIVEASPRLRRVSRHYTRLGWSTILQAYLGESDEFTLSEQDLQFLLQLHSCCTVKEALRGSGVSEAEMLSHLPRVRRLCELGGVDVLS